MKQAGGVPVVREVDGELSAGSLHVSEFTRISGTCVRRGASGAGWKEVVGKLGTVRQIYLFADGHTASNAPDLF